MRLVLAGLFLALLTIPTPAQDQRGESAPLQALIVKTPEQKGKAEALIPSYPIKTCLVSGDALGGMGETVDALYGDRLVRFCCKGCVKSFNKNPAQYLPKLETSAKPAS
jgi:hypothetical protein